jgi:hypothetical protein
MLTGAQFVDNVARKLMLLYFDIGGKPKVDSNDTDFMRGMHACLSLFYEVVSTGNDLGWVRRELTQEAAELYIDNAVRQMVDKYYKVGTSRDQYSTRAQTEFGILAGWVKDWQRKPVACTSGFCKDLDKEVCGALPSEAPTEECARLAVAAAEDIAGRLAAYVKHKSQENAAALCAALWPAKSAALEAFRAKYQQCIHPDALSTWLDDLARVHGTSKAGETGAEG